MDPHRKIPAGRFVGNCGAPSAGEHCAQVSSAAPEVFGPIGWNFLHTIGAHYDATQPDAPKRCEAFLTNTPTMLPCADCRGHLEKYIKQHPPTDACKSREALGRYLVDLHNDVNERTGGGPKWTYDQAAAAYGTAELCVD